MSTPAEVTLGPAAIDPDMVGVDDSYQPHTHPREG